MWSRVQSGARAGQGKDCEDGMNETRNCSKAKNETYSDADSRYAVSFCERVEEHGDGVRVNHAGVDWGPLEIKG